MPFGDDITGAPRTWGSATRMLRGKGADKLTDQDLFGDSNPDDPLSAKKADPLEYLGHFAGDDVATEGHNAGNPAIKRMSAGKASAHAKLGYRKIPGDATSGYVERKTRAAIASMDSKLFGGTVPKGPIDGDAGAPLRKRDREARQSAGAGKGPLQRGRKS